MADKVHILTDKKLEEMERHLSAIYSEAQKDIQKKADEYFDKFKKADEEKAKLVKQGKLTEDEYKQWRKNKIMYGKRFNAMKKDISQQLLNVNKTAVAYINGQIPEVYSLNYNALASAVDGVGGYSFTLTSADTVKHLALTDKSLLPYKKLDPAKDIPWNMKKINGQVLQGIAQGESIPKISKRIMNVQEMNKDSAIRSARTIVTSAENKGRMDSYERATQDGIILEKFWVATAGKRTRDWHAQAGNDYTREKSIPIDEPFIVDGEEMMFPGDSSSASGHNIYNCRCSMGSKVVGFKKAQVEKQTPKTTHEHFDVLQTDEERIEFIQNQFGITREEAQELYVPIAQYGGMRYTQIRQASYIGGSRFDEEIFAGPLTTSFNKMAKSIEMFIERSPKWDGDLYRGINLPPQTVKALKCGDVIDMQGLSSWTSDFNIAESYSYKSNKSKNNTRVIFHAKGTKQGTSIKHLAHYDFEDEVLISTNARWQIDKIEDIEGAMHIYVKELDIK